MSGYHRQEMLDDYMNDGNWKKFVRSIEALVEKWQRAKTGVEETGKAYEELTSRLDAEWIVDWMESEREALEVGGECIKIYEISMDTLPSMADIRLELAEKEVAARKISGSVSWLMEGFNIEKSQHSLQKHVTSLGRKLSASQKHDLLERWNHLAVRISAFEWKRLGFLMLDDDT
ncbi:hypothetical protein PILCRDRAFT_14559 [Piloderma croceum F 1598]|uniref:Uncharacterized protein n=1 Tax=Piloderma croceum (strain F 1598) TaxID=765440 RepID=A0A0C3F2K0_PILCF|nr:hypothetical protein PILCRDRAFT_14559 [Piloderma croceum F 1598]